jgi:hypothetical protein
MDLKLDVSTGDPIYPAPQIIELPALLHGSVRLLGHPLPTVVAEKTVTVLQRGTTSTRWRDFVDVRALARRYPGTDSPHHRSSSEGHRRPLELVARPEESLLFASLRDFPWSAWLVDVGSVADGEGEDGHLLVDDSDEDTEVADAVAPGSGVVGGQCLSA